MYNNLYNNPFSIYNPQTDIDKINAQINDLEKRKSQIQQPVPITQNFQLAPTREVIRYAGSLDEVQREMVIGDTPYFSKDMSVVWIKNAKGEVKTFELNEIVPKDEKDMQIEMLRNEIERMKKEMKRNEANVRDVNATEDTTDTTGDDEAIGTTIEEDKPTSIQRVPTSKKK